MDDAAFAAFGLQAPHRRVDPPVGPRDIASILDRVVAHSPQAEALVDHRRRLTFAELDRAVDGAAHWLRDRGIAPADRVAASLPNEVDIVIAFLAAQRIGAIWVGINRVLSPAEKDRILRHSGARLLLTDEAGRAAIETTAGALETLDTLAAIDHPSLDAGWRAAISASNHPPFRRAVIDPFAPAVIMYTSGTTGAPKGVVHSQHNMAVVCAGASDAGLLRPDSRRGVILPLTITNLMVLGPLMAFWNGQACICGQMAKPDILVDWIDRERIGTCATVPTIVYDVLQADLDLPDHFRMATGGAPLPMPIREGFLARHGYPLGSSYGLTEAPTVVAETRGIDPPSGASGRALPHLHVTIRGETGDPVPAGEIGEVCIGALADGRWADVYVPALGYWQEPDKTAALLRGGVLHSGDMGRLDADGWLYLADRSSELILRGGSNIYPGEVEGVLHGHRAVAACALVGKPDVRLGMRTIAFVEPTMGASDTAALQAELEALCRTSLARYKVPDEWVFVDQFPRNAMGKIQKAVLRERLQSDQDIVKDA
jgi:long-chain acyl-CoA synthetase